MIRTAHIIGLSLAAFVLALSDRDSAAQEPVSREYEIKAVYLYHFCRYVEWPKDAVPGDDSAFIVGVLGPDLFGDHLKRLSDQTVNKKKIIVQRFASIDDFKPCHIVFIAPDDMAEQRLAALRAKTKDTPVLLVGNTPGFVRKGAVFNFFIEQNTVKFEINPDAARRAGLKINAQLYQLPQAKVVKDAPEGK